MKMQTILHVVEIPNSMWANILLNERNEGIKTAKIIEPNWMQAIEPNLNMCLREMGDCNQNLQLAIYR